MSRRTPRLLILPVGGPMTASTRQRVLAHRLALTTHGFDVRIRFPFDEPRPARRWRRVLDLLRDGLAQQGADILFIHRKLFPPAFARLLKRRRRPLVFDMDDALDLPPPRCAGIERAQIRHRRNFAITTAAADLVLCGNRDLALRLPHDRWALLPTPIDVVRFAPGAVAPPSGPTLGWVGHQDNLPFLEALVGPLRELARRRPGLKIIVVADRPPELPGLDVEFRRWTLDAEVSCFGGIGVGLMPLPDTPWTRGKCAFKAIQYLALGIPAVASPVGMSSEVIEDGVSGLLPVDEAGWVAALDGLLADPDRARRMGAAGRRVVEQRYALPLVSARLNQLLDEVLARVRG